MSLEKYVQKIQKARDATDAASLLFHDNAIAIEHLLDECFEAQGFTPMTQNYAERRTEEFKFKHKGLGIEVDCKFNFSNVLELHVFLDGESIGLITVEKPSDELGLQFKPNTTAALLAGMVQSNRPVAYPLSKAIDSIFAKHKSSSVPSQSTQKTRWVDISGSCGLLG
ncbi:hypothetical protein P3C78_03255 [Pseudomonas aeruginosa]